MRVVFQHKAMGNLPECVLSPLGKLRRNHDAPNPLGLRIMVLDVPDEKVKEAEEAVLHLHNMGTIELKPHVVQHDDKLLFVGDDEDACVQFIIDYRKSRDILATLHEGLRQFPSFVIVAGEPIIHPS